ncbi:uncharacterized protein MKZ38_003547 [Zalerion maritima]|uniref:Uncharacterized protein n=1 Tax=Zalerion maritima TaxID=339359 RepID=A0AAD5RML4_9PEZI|nr:uncharacterized protein MKZ38_003547 [Zalerion maritima]
MFGKLVHKLKGDSNVSSPSSQAPEISTSDTAASVSTASIPKPDPEAKPEQKKSLYQRWTESKRGEISDAEVLKYTGKTKEEIREWGRNRPGVTGNQAAGKVNVGPSSGTSGVIAANSYGAGGT